MLSQYMIELWLDRALSEEPGSLLKNAAEDLDGFRLETSNNNVRLISETTPDDGGPPPEWGVDFLPMSSLLREDRDEIEQALMQSWWFKEAAEVARTCTQRIVVTDNLNTGLDYKRRLADIQRIATVLIQKTPTAALWWVPSQQFLGSKAAADSFVEDQYLNPLPGAINVRYYQVPEGAADDGGPFQLMDTLGLNAFGLTDLEICFRGLDPEAVSQTLFNTALYLFDKGPVLRNEETIQGPGANDLWLCKAGTSLSDPARDVWTLDPGLPFSVKT